jgi:hypothetical protein
MENVGIEVPGKEFADAMNAFPFFGAVLPVVWK